MTWRPDPELDVRWFMQPAAHPDFCYGHGRIEPWKPNCFYCGECFHQYEIVPPPDVFACEVCTHDF